MITIIHQTCLIQILVEYNVILELTSKLALAKRQNHIETHPGNYF